MQTKPNCHVKIMLKLCEDNEIENNNNNKMNN